MKFSPTTTPSLNTLAALMLSTGLLSACGGGGGSASNTTPAATTTTLSGVAAVGAPIVGGTVTAKCAAGTATTATTAADGSFSVTLTGATQPCMLELSGGTINGNNHTNKLHSATLADGRVNITTLTELVLAHALKATNTATVSAAYAGTLDPSKLNSTSLEAGKTYVKALLPSLGATAPKVDIVTGTFAADGTGLDAVLDDLGAAMRGKSLTTVSTAVGTDAASTTAPGTPAASVSAVGQKVIKVQFAGVAGSTPVACGNQVLTGLGTTAASAKIKDLRFYISGVKLLDSSGNELSTAVQLPANTVWNYTSLTGDALTLIDLEDGTGACAGGTTATNDTLRLVVPASAVYAGIKMVVGVPESLNHLLTATAPAPLDIASIAWSWQSGYKFAKIELTDPNPGTAQSWPVPTTGTYNTFNFHLGSTGCTADTASATGYTCTTPNRMAFSLAAFDAGTQKVAVDVAALVASNDITRNAGGAPGCMSGGTDPECTPLFANVLKVDLSTGLPLNGGLGQTLFKAISK